MKKRFSKDKILLTDFVKIRWNIIKDNQYTYLTEELNT